MHKDYTINQETVSGFEGPNTYGKYDEKNYASANINDRRHLFTIEKNVNQIKWEANLRDYNNRNRKNIRIVKKDVSDGR